MRPVSVSEDRPGAERPPGSRAELQARSAGRPEAPPLSRAAAQDAQERAAYQRVREVEERRSMLRGLILLAFLVALVALLYWGLGRAFPAGWWRQW